jgi:O-antigen ligase
MAPLEIRHRSIRSISAKHAQASRFLQQSPWNYTKSHPFGGGFEAYLDSKVEYDTVARESEGSSNVVVEREKVVEKGRAFHSSYFEMLGEQGYPGFLIWFLIQATGLLQMELIRRRWKNRAAPDEAWVAPLAVALQLAHMVYLIGSLFVGIAFQPFILMLVGLQCGFWSYLKRIGHPEREAGSRQRRALSRKVQPA